MASKFHTQLEQITPTDVTNIEADFFNDECYIFKVGKYFLFGKSEWDLGFDYFHTAWGRPIYEAGPKDYQEQVDNYIIAMKNKMDSLYKLRSRVPGVFLVNKIRDFQVRQVKTYWFF